MHELEPLAGTIAREPSEFARRLTLTQKLDLLSELSEDDFRDRVVRPVLARRRLRPIADTCGPDEEGKDCVLLGENPLGGTELWAVQTKSGGLSMASDPTKNVATAVAQLRTALTTQISTLKPLLKQLPSHVLLVASGKISNRAKDYILKELNDGRVQVFGAEEFIPLIDENYPEYWLGIAAHRFPYLHELSQQLLRASDTLALRTRIMAADFSPIADNTYAQTYVARVVPRLRTVNHAVVDCPEVVELPLERLLERPDRLLFVTGDGGSGKTTGIRRLAYTVAQRTLRNQGDGLVPVIVRASGVAQTPLRFSEYAAELATNITPQRESPFSAEDLEGGKVLIFVDALDEVSGSLRSIAMSKLLDFVRDFPKCRVILTSREYRSIAEMPQIRAFVHYRVQPIDLRQARKLIDRIQNHGTVPHQIAEETLRRLHDVHGIQLNPLLVTIYIASTDSTREDIPPNITEVFSKFTELMLGRWDSEKGLEQQHRTVIKDFLLKRLAFHMHSLRVRSLGIDAAKGILREELTKRDAGDVDSYFDEIVNRSGLLVVESDHVEFRHHLIQEFFAGRGVPFSAFFREVVHDDWWRTSMVFYFGDHPDDVSALEAVYENLPSSDAVSLFDAAVTVGLALQACYWGETRRRLEVLSWTVRTLADTVVDRSSMIGAPVNSPTPLLAFVSCYLIGRDSVGCKLMRRLSEVDSIANTDILRSGTADAIVFWRIAGLVEAGLLDEVESLLKQYNPSDRRYLLAINMGLVLAAYQRASSEATKKRALQIAKTMEEKISDLRAEAIREFKGLVLEMRRGQIVALPDPCEDDSPAAFDLDEDLKT